VSPMMSDFNPGATNYSKIWWVQETTTDTFGYVVSAITVQWDNLTLYENATTTYRDRSFSFQVRLESTGTIFINYKMAPFDPATVGFAQFGRNYPTRVGISDGVLEFEGPYSYFVPYRSINFNYSYIQGMSANQIQFWPLPGCTGWHNCTACEGFSASRRAFGNPNPLQCSWCNDDAVQYCYDSDGREATEMISQCYNVAKDVAACGNIGSSRGSSSADYSIAVAIGLGSLAIVGMVGCCGWRIKKAVEARARDGGGPHYVRATGDALPGPQHTAAGTEMGRVGRGESDAPPPSTYKPPEAVAPSSAPPSSSVDAAKAADGGSSSSASAAPITITNTTSVAPSSEFGAVAVVPSAGSISIHASVPPS